MVLLWGMILLGYIVLKKKMDVLKLNAAWGKPLNLKESCASCYDVFKKYELLRDFLCFVYFNLTISVLNNIVSFIKYTYIMERN